MRPSKLRGRGIFWTSFKGCGFSWARASGRQQNPARNTTGFRRFESRMDFSFFAWSYFEQIYRCNLKNALKTLGLRKRSSPHLLRGIREIAGRSGNVPTLDVSTFRDKTMRRKKTNTHRTLDGCLSPHLRYRKEYVTRRGKSRSNRIHYRPHFHGRPQTGSEPSVDLS